MKKIKQLLRNLISHISTIFRGLTETGGVLLGIHQVSPGTYNINQLATAGWVFLFGVPIGFLFLGPLFPITTWTTIVLTCLCIINLDSALMLISKFAEEGIKTTLDGEVTPDI